MDIFSLLLHFNSLDFILYLKGRSLSHLSSVWVWLNLRIENISLLFISFWPDKLEIILLELSSVLLFFFLNRRLLVRGAGKVLKLG
jgi:hypothetical protein